VLVIDGHDDTRTTLRWCLETWGLRVIEAATGPEGLQVVSTTGPDAVVTELWLSGFDGYELVRRLRADEKTSAIPIIAHTSRCLPKDLSEAARAGCDAVLAKPSSPDALHAELCRLLTADA
jgi:CheY-like chemotaxis protein